MRQFAASSILAACILFSPIVHAQMSSNDVATVIHQAASAAAVIGTNIVIAVVDREGFVLGVWQVGDSTAAEDAVAGAIGKAGAASYLSSNDHAFTSRTAGFIVRQHFPPGIKYRPPGPLVGVNFSNLPFSDVNFFKKLTNSPTSPAVLSFVPAPVPPTGGLAGTPGGVPLFRNGRLVGGVGVAGAQPELPIPEVELPNLNEMIALAGQRGFEPQKSKLGSRVTIDGFRLAYVETNPDSINLVLRPNVGEVVSDYPIQSSPTITYPRKVLGGVEGEVRQPIMSDPIAGLIENQPRLSAAEVEIILGQAAARSQQTRAGIRLPAGRPAQVFITVVNKPDPGHPAVVLGTFRTPDATFFSWDVAVQKARTALYFSSKTLAISTRAIGFLAQSTLPPGIQDTAPGPLFGFQEKVSLFPAGVVNPLNGAIVPQPTERDPVLINGITIFPGGFPLYRNGVLIGAIGISGDGVDQDDLIGMSGAAGFLPPDEIRSDRFEIRGARLPYAKFPRNPTL